MVNVEFYSRNLDLYNSMMKKRIDDNSAYFEESDLLSLHQNTKGEAVRKV